MLNKMLEKPVRGAWLKGVLAACLLAGSSVAMALGPITSGACTRSGTTSTCELWAKPGSMSLPGATATTVWGYTSGPSGSADGVGNPGGPPLIVNQGDTVNVTLHNGLGVTSGILFQGQNMVPDTSGTSTGTDKTYSFTASTPGTFLYEAAPMLNAEYQVAMGLYGALVVRPATVTQAYDDVSTAFADEAALVLSEIDPALNAAAPGTFDMRNFAPKYFLINGKPYPATDAITGTAGNKLLLRYVNAGAKHHSMSVLGLRQLFVAKDAGLLTSLNYNVAAETLAPGQTGDAIVTVPTTAAATAKFAVYDASLSLHNSDAPGFGGMLAFVNASGTAAPTGPTTSGVTVAPNPANGSAIVALSASLTSASSTVSAAEYLIDTTVGTGTAMTSTFGSATVAASATLSLSQLAALSSGKHTVYVRGQDAVGNWGAFSSAVLNLDKTGPTTTGLTLTPNPSNGTVNVALHATGNDSATGGSNVTAAEYFLGATGANETGIPIPVNVAAPVASLDATIAPPVSSGVVSVHARDALGNWGAFATVNLNVVTGGPVTSDVSASPNPANGVQGANTSTTAVRVSAKMTATAPATVAGAEAFIDTTGANGSGFQFVPSDGAFNGPGQVEWGYGDIPLTTVALLPPGNHTIHVHGRDAAGNWGAFSTTTLTVNQSAPTVTNIALTPAITNSSAVAISASATDVATGNQNIAGGEYFIDTPGAAGTGIAMTAAGTASPTRTLTATIAAGAVAGLAEGSHTVYVRARDAAATANWSAPFATTLVIDRTAPTVVSITRNGASPTNAASVAFTVTYSEAVTGVGTADFALAENLPGTTAISVTGAGATRTVTVTTGSGTAVGTLGLNIPATATVNDLAGNALSTTGYVGPVYAIDKAGPTITSVTVTPATIATGTASAGLTVVATDTSGVVGGEYWFGTANIAAGTGTPFDGSSTTIDTSALTCSTTVRVRMRDTLGNWTATPGSAALTVTPPAGFNFIDGFEPPTNALPGCWSSTSTNNAGRLSTSTAAALAGTYGLQAQGNNTNYVQRNFIATGTYDARLYFNPNNNASTVQDIFAAATATNFNTQLFHVRYRRNGAQPQVQIQVGNTANAAWVNINNSASNSIEVVWQSGTSLQLYVNGALSQTLTAGAGSVAAVRLGSVTSGGSNTLEFFDAFSSKNTASPLIGP